MGETEDNPLKNNKRRRRSARLDTVRGIIREMARTYREVANGDLKPNEGVQRTKILADIRGAVEVGMIEERLNRLEAQDKG